LAIAFLDSAPTLRMLLPRKRVVADRGSNPRRGDHRLAADFVCCYDSSPDGCPERRDATARTA
jgi:hypothetical protein